VAYNLQWGCPRSTHTHISIDQSCTTHHQHQHLIDVKALATAPATREEAFVIASCNLSAIKPVLV